MPAAEEEGGYGDCGEDGEAEFVVAAAGADELGRVVDDGGEGGVVAGLGRLGACLGAEEGGGFAGGGGGLLAAQAVGAGP